MCSWSVVRSRPQQAMTYLTIIGRSDMPVLLAFASVDEEREERKKKKSLLRNPTLPKMRAVPDSGRAGGMLPSSPRFCARPFTDRNGSAVRHNSRWEISRLPCNRLALLTIPWFVSIFRNPAGLLACLLAFLFPAVVLMEGYFPSRPTVLPLPSSPPL